MKNLFSCVLMVVILFSFTIAKDPKFIGVKKCSMCHKSAKQGEQLKIWEASSHANAFKTLQTPEADNIAADKGIEGKAAEAAECLKCHVTGHGMDAVMFNKGFKMEDGVQCETCHGAGSEYKSMKIMKDHAKSVAAGMKDYTVEGAAEAQCKTCHNEESPTYKTFVFEEQWAKIAHPIPEKK
ncbi:MAG: cytochrome c family protein [Ignavibacteria bacterium]|jgi:hypothetical protein